MKTTTLFHALNLPTGTWVIEIAHTGNTTHIDVPRASVRDVPPMSDPWSDIAPITHDDAGTPLYAKTMMLAVLK